MRLPILPVLRVPLVLCWLCLSLPVDLSAFETLSYQPRDNRSEGIKPKPVGGYDLELLSVLADFREAASELPPTLPVRFFLKEPTPVSLTVREQRYKDFYWLDQVVPTSPWNAGFNEFSWPTGDVLRQVDHRFPIENLGVLARLKKDGPSADELVAPAILYHTRLPSAVAAYLFTMKPASDARMKIQVFTATGDTAVWESAVPLAAGDQPVLMRWPVASSSSK